jgi:hypothetical protein
MLMNNFLQDVKYAIRMLAKHPGYTALAVIALGLGIGANTAIFSMGYALLEKPVAVPEAQGLCAIDEYRLSAPGINIGASPAAFADWKEQSRSFSEWAASQYYDTNISGEGIPERVQGFRVSANFFAVLNASPMLGRTFLAEEDTQGRERVAVIGYGLWARRFGADPGLVGRVVRLEGQPYETVGVMPREFDFPVAAELWMPLALTLQERKERAGRVPADAGARDDTDRDRPCARIGAFLCAGEYAVEFDHGRERDRRRDVLWCDGPARIRGACGNIHPRTPGDSGGSVGCSEMRVSRTYL